MAAGKLVDHEQELAACLVSFVNLDEAVGQVPPRLRGELAVEEVGIEDVILVDLRKTTPAGAFPLLDCEQALFVRDFKHIQGRGLTAYWALKISNNHLSSPFIKLAREDGK